jgi:HEAT repeat protein
MKRSSEWPPSARELKRVRRKQAALEPDPDAGAVLILTLLDSSQRTEQRSEAATRLGGIRSREAVVPLIETLATSEWRMAWACSHALIDIGSRRFGRKLIAVVNSASDDPVRQAAIYAIRMLRETRAEDTLIKVAANLKGEEEVTRSMAVETLGFTIRRRKSQAALAVHLFDPSAHVRYSALCALSLFPEHLPYPLFLERALIAKLDDPEHVDDHRVISDLARQILDSRA